MPKHGTLTFFCGKMGAGKTTCSRSVALENAAVLLSEDEWLAAHYPGHINSFDDYIKYASQIKPFVRTLVSDILKSGIDVVMDFPANTVSQRQWFKRLCDSTPCTHELIFLDFSDQQCLANIAKRAIEQPERAAFDNEATFKIVSRHFVAPAVDEGLNIRYVKNSA